MPSEQTNQSTNSQRNSSSGTTNSASGSSGNKPPTRYRVIKDCWDGDRPAFQHSYGLGMDPESIAEGNQIIDAMIKHEYGHNDSKDK